MNRDEAALRFVRLLIDAVLNTGHEQYMEMLSKSSNNNQLAPSEQWFQKLNAEDRIQVDALIKDAMHFTLFGMLSLLDGVSGFDRVDGQPVNYALCAEVFPDMEALRQEKSIESVRINPATERDLYMHDFFQTLTDEVKVK